MIQLIGREGPPVNLCCRILSIDLIYAVEYYPFRVCLDGERIRVRIALFRLVVENSMRLVISREKCENSANFYYFGLVKYYLDRNVRIVERIVKIINYFLIFYLILFHTNIKEKLNFYYFHYPHGR
jgi:hypothetical protein